MIGHVTGRQVGVHESCDRKYFVFQCLLYDVFISSQGCGQTKSMDKLCIAALLSSFNSSKFLHFSLHHRHCYGVTASGNQMIFFVVSLTVQGDLFSAKVFWRDDTEL